MMNKLKSEMVQPLLKNLIRFCGKVNPVSRVSGFERACRREIIKPNDRPSRCARHAFYSGVYLGNSLIKICVSPVGADRAELSLDMDGLEDAVASVLAGREGRVCAPGKWVVWRDANQVKVEIKVKVANQ